MTPCAPLHQIYFDILFIDHCPSIHTHTQQCASNSLISLWIQISADNFIAFAFYAPILVMVTCVTTKDLGPQVTLQWKSLIPTFAQGGDWGSGGFKDLGWSRVWTQRYLAAKALYLCFDSQIPGHPQKMIYRWTQQSTHGLGGRKSRGGAGTWKAQTSAQPHVFSPWIGRYQNPISLGLALGCSERFIELGTIIAEGAPRFFIKAFTEALSDLEEIKVLVVFS